ncbi:hypothetical protein BDZ97DRAFT_1851410 [Flammula alnicola]|nr:hypothetical protein BDZ97DRAFT_1851410 [Flammula alnicola]
MMLAEKWSHSIFNESLSIPFAVASCCLCLQIFHALDVGASGHSLLRERVRERGRLPTAGYATAASLIGCFVLLVLSMISLVGAREHPDPFFASPELFMTLTYLYSTILAILSIRVEKWHVFATKCNTVILLTAFGDSWQGPLLWVKIVVLVVIAVIFPFFAPRFHIPLGPKNPTDDMDRPTDEQMLSLSDLAMHEHLANHLRFDALSMSNTGYTQYLTEITSLSMNPPAGAKPRNLTFSLLRVFRKEIAFMALAIVDEVLAGFLLPIGFKRLLAHMETQGARAVLRPWVWILCIAIGPLLRDIFEQCYLFFSVRTIALAEVIITQLVLEHSLRVRLPSRQPGEDNAQQRPENPAQGSSTTSNAEAIKKEDQYDIEAVNKLLAIDLKNIVRARDFLLLCLDQSLCFFWLLEMATFIAFTFQLNLLNLVTPITKAFFAAVTKHAQKIVLRVKEGNEAIHLLRTIKLFGWERKMETKIQGIRNEELSLSWKAKVLATLKDIVLTSIPTAVAIIIYASYASENRLMRMFHKYLLFNYRTLYLMIAVASLLFSTLGSQSLNRAEPLHIPVDVETLIDGAVTNNQAIGFRDISFSWSNEPYRDDRSPSSHMFGLKIQGELLFKQNCINLIVGPKGCGKTSLLMALLGEMPSIRAGSDSWFNLPRGGGLAYAAQSSWVYSGTIRENILFGSSYDEIRYRKVIRQCALERDLGVFKDGDSTEVGEKGLTLRFARISLARAIYSQAKILLLDDVFSALDRQTSAWIVKICFRGDLVEGRTVLLATNRVDLVAPVAKFVVSIDQDGSIQAGETDLGVSHAEDAAERFKYVELPPLASEVNAGAKSHTTDDVTDSRITWKSLKFFLSGFGGNYPHTFISLCITGFILSTSTEALRVWFLGTWASQYETKDPSEVQMSFYITLCSLVLLATVLLSLGSGIFYVSRTTNASRTIYSSLLGSIMGSTLGWLEETPAANIIARCTQDILIVDFQFMKSLLILSTSTISIATQVAIIVSFVPKFSLPALAIIYAGLHFVGTYSKDKNSLKRRKRYANLWFTVSIRAYGAESRFNTESRERLDSYIHFSQMEYDLNRLIRLKFDVIGALLAAALASYLLYGPSISVTRTGFVLYLAVDLSSLVLRCIGCFSELEDNSKSLERIQSYIDIEQEPKPARTDHPAAWPATGDLWVKNLSARYSKTGPTVLNNLSFHIMSGQRVGVVGRANFTDPGLVRCIPTEGMAYYDHISTSNIDLESLRSKICVIPQTLDILNGTLRHNLDPFQEHDDAKLNNALHAVGFFSLCQELGQTSITLDTDIGGSTSDLSVGQRQILALARAIVLGSKIVIFEETSSIVDEDKDMKSEAVIQMILRHKLARRLQAIMDADKIMVLDDGRMVEFDSPRSLLQREDSLFKALVDKSDDKLTLYAKAEPTALRSSNL